MLWKASTLAGYAVDAEDGSIGTVDGLLFEDDSWTVRWAVIDTGAWLSGRKVLLPPGVLGEPEGVRRAIEVPLTKQQVKDSPDIDTDAPVSRQHESDIYDYYGWAPYWVGYPHAPAMAGVPVPPHTVAGEPAIEQHRVRAERGENDPHLRSTGEVAGYGIHASDGDIGHVEDFIIDTDGWAVRYVIVDTINWWPARKVLVAPSRFVDVNWAERAVTVDLTRDQIRNGPEYDPSSTTRAEAGRITEYSWLPPA